MIGALNALFVGGVVLFWLIALSYGLLSPLEEPTGRDDHHRVLLT